MKIEVDLGIDLKAGFDYFFKPKPGVYKNPKERVLHTDFQRDLAEWRRRVANYWRFVILPVLDSAVERLHVRGLNPPVPIVPFKWEDLHRIMREAVNANATPC